MGNIYELQYRGLVLAYCPDCKKITAFGSKEEAKGFMCRTCSHFVKFSGFANPVSCRCECGQYIKAVTNCTEDIFEFNCKCGYPLALEFSRKKGKYIEMR